MEAVDLLASKLVEVNLWHVSGHNCERCPQVAEGHYLFHDWFALDYDRGENVRLARDKRKELKDPQIVAAVWARDATDFPACSKGKCRYCGTTVYKKTTKGDTRPEMDHVDPKISAGVRNIVLACAKCNRAKGQRTPEQAGLVLLPAPTRKAGSTPSSETIAPQGSQVVAPDVSIPARVVEPQQDLAARFGLRVDTVGSAAPVLSSETIAPQGSQVVAPEPSSTSQQQSTSVEEEAPAWLEYEDPEVPAALTKISTRRGQPPGPDVINEPEAIPGARTRTRGLAGQGRDGLSTGLLQGAPDACSAPPKPRRSRSRRRGKRKPQQAGTSGASQQSQPQQQQHTPNPHDAGQAPHVVTGGRYGSAYFGVKGRREAVPESMCDLHGLDLPCRRCEGAAERTSDE